MSADERLVQALVSLGVPVERQFYTGLEEGVFITFKQILMQEVDYSDDDNNSNEYIYGIDIFSKSNFIQLMKQVIQKIKQEGFYGIVVDPEQYENETGHYHISIEAKYMEEITWQQ